MEVVLVDTWNCHQLLCALVEEDLKNSEQNKIIGD